MRRQLCWVIPLFSLTACSPALSTPVRIRPIGVHEFEFVSEQSTPAGLHRTRLLLRVTGAAGGREVADVLTYENATGAAPLRAATIDPSCANALASPAGAIVRFQVSPPPRELGHVIASCAPEDLWGAVSDVLPLFMVQSQPQFRARALRRVGQHLRFRGYDTRWRIPPAVLDQRIVADSGTITLVSADSASVVLRWDTSPMRVSLVRLFPGGQRALLQGYEWFVAEVRIDARTGNLLDASTIADSLNLRMRIGYGADTVPRFTTDTSGIPVRVVRHLRLTAFRTSTLHSRGQPPGLRQP